MHLATTSMRRQPRCRPGWQSPILPVTSPTDRASAEPLGAKSARSSYPCSGTKKSPLRAARAVLTKLIYSRGHIYQPRQSTPKHTQMPEQLAQASELHPEATIRAVL